QARGWPLLRDRHHLAIARHSVRVPERVSRRRPGSRCLPIDPATAEAGWNLGSPAGDRADVRRALNLMTGLDLWHLVPIGQAMTSRPLQSLILPVETPSCQGLALASTSLARKVRCIWS